MLKTKIQKASLRQKIPPQLKKPAMRSIFTSRNRAMLTVGVITLIIGYIALGLGSITLAPVLLVGAYCVIIPIAIVTKGKKRYKKLEAEGNSRDSSS